MRPLVPAWSGRWRPLLLSVAFLLAACAPSVAPDALQGRLAVKGGGAPFEVATALTAEFSKAHPRVSWDFEDIGSKGGMAAVASGEADLGTASIALLPQYQDRVNVLPIGVSGTAIVVASSNPVTNLTRNQVRDIFTGKINDWSAVGGTGGAITLVVRASETAIWSSFKGYFFDDTSKLRSGGVVASDLAETVNAVKGLSTAVGIVTANSITRNDPSIKLLSIDGVAPTQRNLSDGTYKAVRPLFLLTNKAGVKPAVQAFLDFVRGPEGAKIVDRFQ
ncbi:MAG: phosphate ABC transporter substrate-binding protein [Candidatus Limnocylindrales bacterium]